MPTVESAGVSIHYEVEGRGPPLLLLSGGFLSLDAWREFGYVEALSSEHRLVLLDLRGRGKSDKPTSSTQYSLRAFSEDARAVLAALDISKCDVLAYSFGGWIALSMIHFWPTLFRTMVLLDGFPGSRDPADLQSAIDGSQDLTEDERPVAVAFAAWMAEEIQGAISMVNNAIASVTIPCLLLSSDMGDEEEELQAMRRCEARMPATKLRIMRGLSHFEVFEDSDKVLPHILAYLRQNCEIVSANGLPAA